MRSAGSSFWSRGLLTRRPLHCSRDSRPAYTSPNRKPSVSPATILPQKPFWKPWEQLQYAVTNVSVNLSGYVVNARKVSAKMSGEIGVEVNGGGDGETEMKTAGSVKSERGVKPNVPDYEKGLVYLFQFPRAETIPSISPFCLALETWLRIAGIKYENRVSWTLRSKRGQLPFVEINGEQIADSVIVMNELSAMFNVDLEAHLSEREKSDALAYGELISESLFWACNSEQLPHLDDVMGEKVQGKGFPSWPRHVRFMQKAIVWKLKSDASRRVQAHGIGKYSNEEVLDKAKKYLKALATHLGDKSYLAGEKASTVDAIAFGHLGQIYYPPLDRELKKYMTEECGVLVKYVERIQEKYWPDWEEVTTKVEPNTEWMKNVANTSTSEPENLKPDST